MSCNESYMVQPCDLRDGDRIIVNGHVASVVGEPTRDGWGYDVMLESPHGGRARRWFDYADSIERAPALPGEESP